MLVKQTLSAIWRGTLVAPIVGLSVPVLFTLRLHPQDTLLNALEQIWLADMLTFQYLEHLFWSSDEVWS